MPAVVGPLEFDHDQASIVIDAQQVYPAPGILEVAELLGNHEQPVPEHLNVVAQGSLEMRPLQDSLGSEGGERNGREGTVGHVEQHGYRMQRGYQSALASGSIDIADSTLRQGPSLNDVDLRKRLTGCLLAGAVGDALGHPVEFLSWTEIGNRFGPGGVSAPARPASFTDDTQMSLFTAEGLIRARVRQRTKGICHPVGAEESGTPTRPGRIRGSGRRAAVGEATTRHDRMLPVRWQDPLPGRV